MTYDNPTEIAALTAANDQARSAAMEARREADGHMRTIEGLYGQIAYMRKQHGPPALAAFAAGCIAGACAAILVAVGVMW